MYRYDMMMSIGDEGKIRTSVAVSGSYSPRNHLFEVWRFRILASDKVLASATAFTSHCWEWKRHQSAVITPSNNPMF